MKQALFLIFSFIVYSGFSQDFKQLANDILTEGIELYRSERASWISTDSIPEQDRQLIGGYFTYPNGQYLHSIYVDTTENNAVYKFTFEPIGNMDIELVRTEKNVELSIEEKLILEIRKNALATGSYWYQSFGYSRIVNPNVIIHKTKPEFEVYIIPGTFEHGLLPIGGDIYLTYKSDGKLGDMEPIHNNLIPMEISTNRDVAYMAHEHKGKRLGKKYITATDICTLLLYRDYLNGEKHLTVHKKFVSEFYFNEPRLVIRPNTEKLKLR